MHRMNRRIKPGLLYIPIFIGGLFLFNLAVMLLWNGILPAVLGVKAITFWQSLGILVLSKILFGGFGGRHWRGRSEWKQKMKQRWDTMTPEEKEKFKDEWKSRCGGRWKMHSHSDPTTMSAE